MIKATDDQGSKATMNQDFPMKNLRRIHKAII
jgi:hypothetical protein